jgi:GT2 family glycosyltransferase
MKNERPVVCVGIPCYDKVNYQVLTDYMRFIYYCGRRLREYDFVLGIKGKTEQFRARNMIVEAALQMNSDYLFFLDDDHILDWEETPGPNTRYGIVKSLIKHLEEDETRGIVGALYYHRGGDCNPVIMKEGKDGGYYYMREDEVRGELQEVAVTGGGCMMIKKDVFLKSKSPWFEPEFECGTDVQICKRAREAGYSVWCDTSLVVGHIESQSRVVTSHNRLEINMANANHAHIVSDGITREWRENSTLLLYRQDAEEYTGKKLMQLATMALDYDAIALRQFSKYEDPKEYYASLGNEQIARQVFFHHQPTIVEQMNMILYTVNPNLAAHGLDYCCGSAPIGFELAMRGHTMDFIDVDGAPAYEFVKWRVKKRGIADRCGFKLGGRYDFVLFLDAIEHLPNWEEVLEDVISRMKDGAAFITNYFKNMDFSNPEHISMDHKAVRGFLIDRDIYPVNILVWCKNPKIGMMDKGKENADAVRNELRA